MLMKSDGAQLVRYADNSITSDLTILLDHWSDLTHREQHTITAMADKYKDRKPAWMDTPPRPVQNAELPQPPA